MSRRVIVGGLSALTVVIAIAVSWLGPEHATGPQRMAITPAQLMGHLVDDQSFERVTTSTKLAFPGDHGPHREFRTEWWYLTGSLHHRLGRRLGLQLVLMRVGLVTQPQQRSSHWAATELLAGLFSVSNPAGNSLHSEQRVGRAALGLAGAEAQPMRVWIDDWHLRQMATSGSGQSLSVRVTAEGLSLTLALRTLKPLIEAHDIRGRQPETFAPFHFYIQPRLAANGRLRIGEKEFPVNGTLAIEHAWGELPLPGGPVALDRFMLHLGDGRELFCVRTHRVDGSGKPETTGLLVAQDGRALALPSREVDLVPTEHWVSKRTGARYPIRWMLRVRTHGIHLELLPHSRDQEGVGWMPFWASAVRLQGTSPTMDLTGDGFVQLNGYHQS